MQIILTDDIINPKETIFLTPEKPYEHESYSREEMKSFISLRLELLACSDTKLSEFIFLEIYEAFDSLSSKFKINTQMHKDSSKIITNCRNSLFSFIEDIRVLTNHLKKITNTKLR